MLIEFGPRKYNFGLPGQNPRSGFNTHIRKFRCQRSILTKKKIKKNNLFLDKKKMNIIKAHQSALCGLELNPKGIKLATASEKVFLILIKIIIFFSKRGQ